MPYKPAESYSITKEEADEMFEVANIVGKDRDWSVAQTIEYLVLEAGRTLAKQVKERQKKETEK